MDIIEKASAAVREHNMVSDGQTVLVGLSGGPDSVCLLRILKRLPLEINLHALYVEHGLRPVETPGEIEFCKKLCIKENISFHVKSIDVKSYSIEHRLNLQEAARTLRYRAFEQTMAEISADRVALGHNLDDQIETFFMRILRGAGPQGLSSIPAVRAPYIRPLINISREEITGFLNETGTGYIVDSSNLKKDYLRNAIRFSLIPAMKEFNPDIYGSLSRTIEILREEDRHLAIQVTKTLMKLITNKTENEIELFLSPLEIMDRAILRRVLRRSIEETRGLRGIGFIHIENILKLIKSGRPGDRLYLPDGIRAVKQYSTLLLTSEPPVGIGAYALDKEGEISINEASIVINAALSETEPAATTKTTAVFDAEKASFPLAIRARRPGDFFHPLGFGKRKKLQDFFVDEKIPRDLRDSVPIVTKGNDIVWVAGMRGDERFKPTGHTKVFLILRLMPGARK